MATLFNDTGRYQDIRFPNSYKPNFCIWNFSVSPCIFQFNNW